MTSRQKSIVSEIRRLDKKDMSGKASEEEVWRAIKLRDQRKDEMCDSVPRLTCCETARNYHAVYFTVDESGPCWLVGESNRLGENRRKRDRDWYKNIPSAKFCPFCAAPVPKMRAKAKPSKDVCRITDGGYYCDTCRERLIDCLCLPPEAGYEPE